MAFLRFSRDKRGYENVYLVQPAGRRGKSYPRLLYWFRTPPNVKVGREPFDESVRRSLEAQHPDVVFNWSKLLATPFPPADPERWRERRRERAARRAADAEVDAVDTELSLESAANLEHASDRANPTDLVNAETAEHHASPGNNAESEGEPASNNEARSAEPGELSSPAVTAAEPRRRHRRRRRRRGAAGGGGVTPAASAGVETNAPDLDRSGDGE